MQFVPGQTLERHMRLSGPMREADAQDVFSKVLAAVAYLHTRSIIHCDIKPSNFLLRQRAAAAAAGAGGGAAAAGAGGGAAAAGGAAKSAPPVASSSLVVTAARFDVLLCDFGNARHSRDAKYYKQTGDVSLVPCAEVTGTCGYIAPEILERHSYDASVDMWSCGVLLYKVRAWAGARAAAGSAASGAAAAGGGGYGRGAHARAQMLSGSLPMSNTAEDVLFQGALRGGALARGVAEAQAVCCCCCCCCCCCYCCCCCLLLLLLLLLPPPPQGEHGRM